MLQIRPSCLDLVSLSCRVLSCTVLFRPAEMPIDSEFCDRHPPGERYQKKKWHTKRSLLYPCLTVSYHFSLCLQPSWRSLFLQPSWYQSGHVCQYRIVVSHHHHHHCPLPSSSHNASSIHVHIQFPFQYPVHPCCRRNSSRIACTCPLAHLPAPFIRKYLDRFGNLLLTRFHISNSASAATPPSSSSMPSGSSSPSTR